MSEGRFWRCTWELDRNGYRVWVASRPRLAARGVSWQEALDNICDRIGNATGDGEPNLSFDPPEPTTGGDKAFAHPKWLMLGAEGDVKLAPFTPDLFTRGFCPRCGDPVGERSQKPLTASGPGDGDLCWPWYAGSAFNPVMCSERFVEALSDAERRPFRWLPVALAPRCKKKYFECIPRRIVLCVGVRGWTTNGSHCPECKRNHIRCTPDRKIHFETNQIHEWVADEDLPRQVRGMIAFGNPRSWLPILPIERARTLARTFKGVRTAQIGRAPDHLIDRTPDLTIMPQVESTLGLHSAPKRKPPPRA